MVNQARRFSFPLVWAGVVALVASAVLYFLNGWELWTQAALALGLILVALFVVLEPNWLREKLTGRSARYGSNAVILTLAFLVILGLLVFLATRYNQRWDVTANRQFTLAEQTVSILQNLQQPIKVTGIFQEGRQSQLARDLMKEYTNKSNLITYEAIDPVLQPSAVQQLGVFDALLLQAGDRKQVVYGVDEESITSGILKLTQDKERVVYFTTGHREYNVAGGGARDGSYGLVRRFLEQDSYKVLPINLAISATIPSDAAVLVVAGPQQPFSDAETNTVKSYLDQGGKGMFLFDPLQDSAPNPLFDLLSLYGVRPRNDVVVSDPQNALGGDLLTPATLTYGASPITEGMQNLTTFYPRTRSVEIINPAPSGATATPLVQTGPQSWGETDLNGLRTGQVRPDGNDARGPLALVAQVERPGANGSSTRLVVMGNGSFVSDDVIQRSNGGAGNPVLFMNAINWLAENEAQIGIRPKATDDRSITMTGGQERWLFLTSVLALPLAVLVYGVGVWWRRR